MNLDMHNWKEFKVSKIFYKLKPGKANDGMLADGDDCIYIGAKKNDNGVMRHCAYDAELVQNGNCIIFICNGQGSVGYANYMNREFIGTTDIVAGYCNSMNEYIGVFLATVFCLERPKYSFGRKWKTHLKDTTVNLPIQHNSDGSILIDEQHTYSEDGYVPDWAFMEDYIKSLHYKPLTTKNHTPNITLNVSEWKDFFLKDICEISMGNKMDFAKMTFDDPAINFVGRSAENNGVNGVVDLIDEIEPYKSGCITVALGGSLGSSYIQYKDFYTSQNVAVLKFENTVDIAAKIFITTSIMNECKYKYFPFGRELNTHIRTDFSFYLPVKHNIDGSVFIDEKHKYSDHGYVPDWKFMSDYIRSLPYGDRL